VAELTIRLVASLAVVVGLMLLLARFVGKRYGARAGAPVQVLHRQPLSRGSGVAVVAVGSRVLVIGTTDHQVSLLAELDPDELDVLDDVDVLDGVDGLVTGTDDRADALAAAGTGVRPPVPTPLRPAPAARAAARASAPGSHRASHRAAAPRRAADAGGLAGSVLSPQTWRQALAAATGKAS
jgi:flagellar protein FliO/FliZ